MQLTVRRAQISQQLRDDFERYGKDVVALALGLGVAPRNGQSSQALQIVFPHQSEAAEWLREKRDEEARQIARTELLGWAILLLVSVAVACEFLLLWLLLLLARNID